MKGDKASLILRAQSAIAYGNGGTSQVALTSKDGSGRMRVPPGDSTFDVSKHKEIARHTGAASILGLV